MCDTADSTQASSSPTVTEEPLLGGSQQVDIDLLAAEIAEAATEEERRSRTPSPELDSTSQDDQHTRLQVQDDVEDVDKDSKSLIVDVRSFQSFFGVYTKVLGVILGVRDKKEEDEESSNSDVPMDMSVIQEMPSSRNIDDSVIELSVTEESSSGDIDDGVMEMSILLQQDDMDDASWVLVDADIDDPSTHLADDTTTESEIAAKLKCVFRKFLAGHEMGDKLLELGLTCDTTQESSSQQIDMDDSGIDQPSENFLKSIEETTPKIMIWRGEVSGAKVCVEGESKGGILVADVRLWHTDLLQALTALKNLANNAGLISYADVDISSILARAA